MWHQGEHLCLNRPIARMPMGYSFPARRNQLVREGSKLRFLLIYSDPGGNLPAARKEVEQIQAGLERDWKDQIDIKVIDREQASGHELNSLLWTGAYDVIHYAGHAHFDENDHELSGLILKDEEIFFAQKIRRILEGKPLVFLNACESGRTANEENAQEVKQYLQKPAEGLAASFIYGGAIGCIGSLWPVYDEPAAQFAIQLYNKVLEGYMIGEAMRLVRRKIREDFKNQITWASFVLYGDPTFRLRIS
jgi:CHAT domain-containing protein